MRFRKPLITLGLSLMLTAMTCFQDDEDETPAFSGDWEGDVADMVLSIDVDEDEDGDFEGTGQLSGPGGTLDVDIEGEHDHPDVTFTMSAEGFDPAEFEGEFDGDDTVEGELNGSGFFGEEITLERE